MYVHTYVCTFLCIYTRTYISLYMCRCKMYVCAFLWVYDILPSVSLLQLFRLHFLLCYLITINLLLNSRDNVFKASVMSRVVVCFEVKLVVSQKKSSLFLLKMQHLKFWLCCLLFHREIIFWRNIIIIILQFSLLYYRSKSVRLLEVPNTNSLVITKVYKFFTGGKYFPCVKDMGYNLQICS